MKLQLANGYFLGEAVDGPAEHGLAMIKVVNAGDCYPPLVPNQIVAIYQENKRPATSLYTATQVVGLYYQEDKDGENQITAQ